MRFLSLLIFLSFASCTYTAKITDGATAIDRKQYDVAVPMLKKEFKRAKTRSEKGKIAMHLGKALIETSNDEAALDWLQAAYDNSAGPEALKMKADALKRLERYDEAITVYTDLGFEIGSKYEYRKDIAGAELAKELKAKRKASGRKEYEVEPGGFNSRAADYAPVLFQDQLVFTSDRPDASGDETYAWTGRGFSDLFVANPTTDEVQNFSPNVNSSDNEGTPTFGPSGGEMIFTRCSSPIKRADAYCSLYRSEKIGNGWSVAEKLPFVRPEANYMHPALTADGRRLYFSANPTDGWGGYDIYYVDRFQDGTWGVPKLMNRAVNTEGNEQFPSVDADTLYFASDGHEGLGGLDIYRVHIMDNGQLSAAKNLKLPVNSGGDDFAYTVVERTGSGLDQETRGYFSSSRPGGQGGDDIYRFTKRVLPPPPPSPIPIEYKNVLDIFVVEKIYQDPNDPTSPVLGLRPVPNATIVASIGDQSRTVNTNEDGELSLVVVDDQTYNFRAERDEYLAAEGRFSSRNLPRDPEAPEQRYEIELEIEKIFRNQEIVLDNIYYDFDEYVIRDDAKPTLSQLADVLQRNPIINIELGSHTDCQGRDAYNEELSQQRAEAAVEYLVSQGIEVERLSAQGYGETQPVAECICERCTEEQHQQNRRTTFRILD